MKAFVPHGGPIPACAGETLPLREGPTFFEADPRVCGGDGGEMTLLTDQIGRSPRVRGRLCDILSRFDGGPWSILLNFQGSIPANPPY